MVGVPENKKLLVFGRRAYVFIIDLTTMRVVQVINPISPILSSSNNMISGLDVYYDKVKNKSVVLVNFHSSHQMLSFV